MRCSVVFGVTQRLLVNHKHFVVVSRYQHRRLLPAISVTTCGTVVRQRRIDNTWPVAALTAASEAKYRLRIAISAYSTCIRRPHRNIAMLFGVEKLEWCGWLVATRRLACDRQTNRRTDRHLKTA